MTTVKTSKISFDFDGCLGEDHIQMIAMLLVSAGADVWVITSRTNDAIIDENGAILGNRGVNDVVRNVCSRVGIPLNKIIYTNGDFKVNEYAKGNFDLHFDDQFDEVELIRRNGGNALLVDFSIYDIKQAIESVKDVEVYFKRHWED